VYPASVRVFRPWRNGGGETAEILASPAAADLDGFDWRISTARVDRSGPFSLFPAVDRVLAVIEGGAMRIEVGGTVLRVGACSDPVTFPGDQPCVAHLEGEPLLDLNVMARRPWRAEVSRTRLGAPSPGRDEAAQVFALLLEAAGGLGRLDLVDLGAAPDALRSALAGTTALLVRVTRA
jgi:hypothetical protein